MAELSTKYRVVVSGNLLPEADREQVLAALAELFHSNIATMEALLQGQPVALKKAYSHAEANRIRAQIHAAGAACDIEPIAASEISEPPLTREQTGPRADTDSDEYVKDGGEEVNENVDEDMEEDLKAFAAEHADDDFNKELGDAPMGRMLRRMLRLVAHNIEFYRDQFLKFGPPWHPHFRLTWNWPAFFFFFFWALYRRMWFYAGMHFAGSMFLVLYPPPTLLALVWLFVWPAVANYLYFKQIAAVVIADMEGDKAARPGLLADRRGGVSRAAVGVGIGAVMVAGLMLGNFLVNQFIAEHEDQLREVLPGSGSQVRGDGSLVELSAEADSALSKTSYLLSYYAVMLKILMVKNAEYNDRKAIDWFIDKLKGEAVEDEWGSRILIEQDVFGYLLRSPGPDRQPNTADDLIQRVTQE